MSINRTIISTILAIALVAVVAPGVTQGVTIDELMAQIAALQAQLTGLSGTPASTGTGACAGVTFSRNLTVGSTGSDVKCLQTILNNKGFKVATTGVGSAGYETTYFGAKTLVAVKAYQVSLGYTPANQVGPMTRAALNAVVGTTPGIPPVVTPTGAISATVASTSPAAGALIASQAQAKLLDVAFVGSGTVTSVTLQRSGISDQNTLTNIYLYDGAVRLTDGYAFNINGTTTIGGLNIAVNGSKTISVKADTANSTILFTTYPASSIAVALTGFNGSSAIAQGAMMQIVRGSGATVSFAANTATGSSINTGTSQYAFWTAQLSVSTRAVQLNAANFKMIGSAPANALTNVRLFIDGVDTGRVASVVAVQGSNYEMFDLTSSPVTLTTGTHTVDVRADVSTGSSRTIELSLQSAADITLFDSQVGINVSVGTTNIPSNGASLIIASGSSTIVVDPTFNSQSNITAGATNVTIGKFIIHGYGEDVKVNDLYVSPLIGSSITSGTATGNPTVANTTCTGGTNCAINNVTLYFNGVQVGSQKNWTGLTATQLDYTLGSQMIIPAGQDSTLEVKADLQDASSNNYTAGVVGVKIVGQPSTNAYGQVSQSSIKFPDTSSVYTNGLTISSASLQVSKNTSMASTTAAPNTANVKIGSFTLQNQSTSEAVRLTTLTVGLYESNGVTALTAGELTGLASLRTSDTTGSASTPIQPTATNTFSVSDVLQPNASMTIDIYANVGSSSLIGYVVSTLKVASIGVTSNVSSAGTAKTGQTLTFGTGTITPGSAVVTSGSTASQYVVGGTANASQATFSFISASGASTISELKFEVTGSDANPTQTVTNVCVGAICAQPISGHADITGLSLVVPNGGSGLNQAVTVSYASVGTGGVIPSKTAKISLEYVKYTSGGTTTTLTGTTLGGADFTSVAAPTITLVGGKPTIVVAAGGNKGMVLNQSTKVGQATITATSGAIKVRTIVFNVTWAGYSTLPTTTSAQSLTDAGGNTLTDFTCTSSAVTNGAATVTCTTAGSYATDFPIGLNQSQEFDLYVTTGGAANNGSATPTVGSSLAKSTFKWDDTSDNNVSTLGTNLDGTLIYGFPTNSYTISQ